MLFLLLCYSYSSHKVLKHIIRTFIVLAGIQNQCHRVTDCLLMHDVLPSYRNGVLPLNRSVYSVKALFHNVSIKRQNEFFR